MTRRTALALPLFLALPAGSAWAQEPGAPEPAADEPGAEADAEEEDPAPDTAAVDAEAAPLAREGIRLFKDHQYEPALDKLRAAEAVYERAELAVPISLLNALGRAYDQLGQIVAALRYKKKFLGRVDRSDARLADVIKRADQAVERLETQLARTMLTFEIEPDGAEVRVDRRAVGKAPLDAVQVTPGPHQVTLWAEGHEPASVNVEVAAGASVPVVVTLVPEADETPVVVVQEESSMKWWLVGGGVVAAAAVGTVALLLLTAEEPPPEHKVRFSMQGL